MPIKFSCPNCTARIRAEDSKAGRSVKCPKCKERLRVPPQTLESAASPPAAASQSTVKPKVDRDAPASREALFHSERSEEPLASFLQSLSETPQATTPLSNRASGGKSQTSEMPSHDVPDDIPRGVTWYETVLKSGQVQRLTDIKQVRDLFVAGKIDRFSPGREVYARPPGGNDAVKEEVKEWQERTSWRPLGEGLCLQHFVLKSLYEPVGLHMFCAARVASFVTWPIGFFVLIFADIQAHGGFDNSFWAMLVRDIEFLPVKLFFIGLFGVAGFPVGLLFGLPVGTGIGAAIAGFQLRTGLIRRPPPDGFSPFRVYDLHLMSIADRSEIPTQGANIVYVAKDSCGQLHIRIFDEDGEMILDVSGTDCISTERLETLKQRLAGLWDREHLTIDQKRAGIAAIALAFGFNAHLQVTPFQQGPLVEHMVLASLIWCVGSLALLGVLYFFNLAQVAFYLLVIFAIVGSALTGFGNPIVSTNRR